jgi:hypothetical protein
MWRLINVTKGLTKAQDIELWNPRKISKAMGARHNFHPTYLACISIGFPNI